MKTFLIIVGGIVALVVILFAWLLWRTHAGGRAAYAKRLDRIRPVVDRLAAGQDPDPADLERFAANRETRGVLYDTLESAGKLDLFPRAWLSQQAMAEADLVGWLCHPNELGSPPDDIELVEQVPSPGGDDQHYYVFRYRVSPPHWNAAKGWMAGVAGPYTASAPVSTHARGTFSRFEPIDARTAQEHVRIVHEQIVGGGSR